MLRSAPLSTCSVLFSRTAPSLKISPELWAVTDACVESTLGAVLPLPVSDKWGHIMTHLPSMSKVLRIAKSSGGVIVHALFISIQFWSVAHDEIGQAFSGCYIKFLPNV